MGKFKSVVITTLYHGGALAFIFIMLIFSYIGANTLIPEWLNSSNDLLLKTAYSLLQAAVSVIGLAVMCYPIINWITDICDIYSTELSSSGSWVLNILKTFVSGGINAVSNRKKDTP